MMLTRCPECATVFRVTPEQLKARQGRVRCGRCHRVFNAIDALIENVPATLAATTEPEEPIAETRVEQAPILDVEEVSETSAPVDAAPATETSSEGGSGSPEGQEEAPLPAPVSEVTETIEGESEIIGPETGDTASGTERREEEEAVLPVFEESAVNDEAGIFAPVLHADTFAAAESSSQPAPPMEPMLPEPPRQRFAQTRAWLVLSGLFLALAVWQVVLLYRVDLAIQLPQLRQVFTSICDTFGCDMPLPRRIDLVSIEASDLNPDAPSEGRLKLTATLKNRADFAQEYPDLELTLTDTKDQPLLRRALAPNEYLATAPLASGFSAGGELSVALTIDAPGVAATGYRLYVFYP